MCGVLERLRRLLHVECPLRSCPRLKGSDIPLTIPAHQAPVLPLKLWRPQWFDATALCIGSALPDLLYPFAGDRGHSFPALVVLVPLTVLTAAVLRWRAAPTVFAQFPDLYQLRLRSYSVISRRRPRLAISVVSALIGVLSHIVIDAFTHSSRWGSRWAGFDAVWMQLPMRGDLSIARTLQYLGHTVGSVVGLLLFLYIGRNRLLEQWYGSEAVLAARRFRPCAAVRLGFWSVSALTTVAVVFLAAPLADSRLVFSIITGLTIGMIVAGCIPALGPSRSGPGTDDRTVAVDRSPEVRGGGAVVGRSG